MAIDNSVVHVIFESLIVVRVSNKYHIQPDKDSKIFEEE